MARFRRCLQPPSQPGDQFLCRMWSARRNIMFITRHRWGVVALIETAGDLQSHHVRESRLVDLLLQQMRQFTASGAPAVLLAAHAHRAMAPLMLGIDVEFRDHEPTVLTVVFFNPVHSNHGPGGQHSIEFLPHFLGDLEQEFLFVGSQQQAPLAIGQTNEARKFSGESERVHGLLIPSDKAPRQWATATDATSSADA
jgi:hypothetical protein